MNTYFIAQSVAPAPVTTPPKTTKLDQLANDPLAVGLICAAAGAIFATGLTYILTKAFQQSKFNKKIEELYMETKYVNVLTRIEQNMATKDDIEEVKGSIESLDKRVESLERASKNGFESISKSLFNWNQDNK